MWTIAALWWIVGLGSVAYMVHLDIQEGVDYTIKDLLIALMASLMGPATLFIVLMLAYGNKVVLKGKEKE
jgi:hypothetical protein